MTTKAPAAILAIALALALAACGGGNGGTASSSTPPGERGGAATTSPSPPGPAAGASSAPPSPSGRPTASPRAVPANARLLLRRSGGIAGREDTITVEPDGRWTRVERGGATRAGRLSDGQRSRLRGLLADPRLAGESGTHASTTCRDSFTYALSAGSVAVTYQDCLPGSDQPPVTRSIVDLLAGATG